VATVHWTPGVASEPAECFIDRPPRPWLCKRTQLLLQWLYNKGLAESTECAANQDPRVIQVHGLNGLCDRPPLISASHRCRWCSRARTTAHPVQQLLEAPELRASGTVSSVQQLVRQLSIAQQRIKGPDKSFAERSERSHRDNGWSAVHECHYEVNFCPLARLGTIEFRASLMTFEGAEAAAWTSHVSNVMRIAFAHRQEPDGSVLSELIVGDVSYSWSNDSQGVVHSSVSILKTA